MTILDTITYTKISTLYQDLIIALFIAAVVSAVLIAVVTLGYSKLLTGVFTTIIIVSVVLIIYLFISPDTHEEHTKYVVTVDDTISAREFMDTYNILEINGHTYTIEEK